MSLTLKPTLRARIGAAWNRALDLAFAPVLNHLTDEEYFGARTRLHATARFVRRGAWFGTARAEAACAARLAAWHAEADRPHDALRVG